MCDRLLRGGGGCQAVCSPCLKGNCATIHYLKDFDYLKLDTYTRCIVELAGRSSYAEYTRVNSDRETAAFYMKLHMAGRAREVGGVPPHFTWPRIFWNITSILSLWRFASRTLADPLILLERFQGEHFRNLRWPISSVSKARSSGNVFDGSIPKAKVCFFWNFANKFRLADNKVSCSRNFTNKIH